VDFHVRVDLGGPLLFIDGGVVFHDVRSLDKRAEVESLFKIRSAKREEKKECGWARRDRRKEVEASNNDRETEEREKKSWTAWRAYLYDCHAPS
jgi:hypothetical protein